MTRAIMFSSLLILFLGLPETASARLFLYGKARETIPVAFGVEPLFRFPMEVNPLISSSL